MAVAGPKIRVSYELLEDKIATSKLTLMTSHMVCICLAGISTTDEQQQLEEEEATMVQVFMVVRCYSCKIFQVHQVRQ